MNDIITIKNLRIEGRPPGGAYVSIVKDVSLNVRKGEVLALIGESGSGKSTISLAAMGFARPGCRIAGGEVWLNGRNIMALSPRERHALRGDEVSYVAQSAAASFNPALRIGKQVIEAPLWHGVGDAAALTATTVELYRKLDLPNPETVGQKFPHQVSGGQLQRLMAAMAMSCGPDLLILDEPTTALDVTTQIEVLKAFKDIIRDQGTAAIYVTHDLAVVAQVADRILVLKNGEMVEEGPTDQILHNPQHEYTRTLMAAVRPAPHLVDHVDASAAQAPVVSVRNVTAGYGTLTILSDVSVDVPAASVVGVIGESGCGKSTLARVVAGLTPLRTGEIMLDGQVAAPNLNDRPRAALKDCQIVFQMADTALNPRQRISDILGRPLEFYQGLKGSARADRIGDLLELVDLPRNFASRYPGELSGGQKQRINLARALAADPKVILCDEVTSALDTVVAAGVIELLKSLKDKLGVAYMFISHDLSTVASFADEVVVLYAGRVVEQGPSRAVFSPPFHPYTKLLFSSVPEMRQGWLEGVADTREAKAASTGSVVIGAKGCPFSNRCALAISGTCETTAPPIRELPGELQIACHLPVEQLPLT
ncbi:MAG: ABC transporter ATP-binding protein [Sulfitobacter sp.]